MGFGKDPETGRYVDTDGFWDNLYATEDLPIGNFPEEAEKALKMVDAIKVRFNEEPVRSIGDVTVKQKVKPGHVNPDQALKDVCIQETQAENVGQYFESLGYDVEIDMVYELPSELQQIRDAKGAEDMFFDPSNSGVEEPYMNILEEHNAVFDLTDFEPDESVNLPEKVEDVLEDRSLIDSKGKANPGIQSLRRMHGEELYVISPELSYLFQDKPF